MYTKINQYGAEYECRCDYSYTCDGCKSVREEFARRDYQKEIQEWIVEAIQRIAQKAEVVLPELPEKRYC
ncbi:MAG: hypothetical protein KGO96_07055 [Elusimicrobia bacterium]|nr:hypothetical protein [Elusimicrobiota bacterium]